MGTDLYAASTRAEHTPCNMLSSVTPTPGAEMNVLPTTAANFTQRTKPTNHTNPTPSVNSRSARGPLRALVLTALLTLAGGAMQAAHAMPGGPGGSGGPGGRGHMGMASPEHLDRMLDSINATVEQRAQIKQMAAAARTDMQAIRQQGRALHQQSQALFAQPTVDARAAETLRQQTLAQHDLASKRRLQMRLDMSRVLSAQQRQQLTERMAKRQSMMERHRTERDALNQPAPR